jgi:hypothetical protein
MEDAEDPFYSKGDVEAELDGRREQVTPQTLTETMRSFNQRLIKDQEEQNEINIAIVWSINDIQEKVQWGSNPSCTEQTKSVGS